MELKNMLKKRRQELGLTMLEVAKNVGVSEATVSRWESGDIANMRRDKIVLLASALKISPALIMGWDNKDILKAKNIIELPTTKQIPLLGTIACGTPILAQENIEEMISVNQDINADFALRCNGDSMINARIHAGDIVYIHKQTTVENGQIAAVLIGDEATLKRVYIYPNKLVLVSENAAYEPLVFSDSELDQIRILGRAVAFMSRIG